MSRTVTDVRAHGFPIVFLLITEPMLLEILAELEKIEIKHLPWRRLELLSPAYPE
jgi:hypothetical protein